MNHTLIKTDVVIIGGGVAGLWALNRLKDLGYSVLLLESHALGSGQTIKSQGIIHGGMKYALKGFLSKSSNIIEDMPRRWKACLNGSGDIDLRSVNLLSDHQLLFSTGSLSSDLLSFFGSFTLSSRVKKLSTHEFPPLLQNTQFKGQIYRLDEIVLDIPSLLTALAEPFKEFIYQTPITNKTIQLSSTTSDIEYLHILDKNNQLMEIKAQHYIFLAGESNAHLLQGLTQSPAMQVRPLQMVYAKMETPFKLFGHCIDNGINPRVTITTHQAKNNTTVWYLGGQIAEDGAKRTTTEQIAFAQAELQALFPWLNKQTIQIDSFMINRAEPKQLDGKRPDNVFLETIGNTTIAWPIKLALSPVLIDEIIQTLQLKQIIPNSMVNTALSNLMLERPSIAHQPWD